MTQLGYLSMCLFDENIPLVLIWLTSNDLVLLFHICIDTSKPQRCIQTLIK